MNFDTEFSEKLLASLNYRDFLSCFFKKDREGKNPKPLSYEGFARRANFKSKSFIADVIAGRKRLSQRSLAKTSDGMGLGGLWKEYFENLVYSEESVFWTRQNSRKDFQDRLGAVRTQLRKQLNRKVLIPKRELLGLLLQEHFPTVFASLGSTEKGSTISEISARSRLSEKIVSELTSRMIATGLAERHADGVRIMPKADGLESYNLDLDQIFIDDFKRSLVRGSRRIRKQFRSENALFLVETYSIDLDRMPDFRRELRAFIKQFVSKSESPEGNCIAELCVSYTHND